MCLVADAATSSLLDDCGLFWLLIWGISIPLLTFGVVPTIGVPLELVVDVFVSARSSFVSCVHELAWV